MTKDEKILEILNYKPVQKIGLDDFYGRQTVINMLKEAINYSYCCKSDSEQLSKRPNTSSTWECFTKSEKQQKGNV